MLKISNVFKATARLIISGWTKFLVNLHSKMKIIFWTDYLVLLGFVTVTTVLSASLELYKYNAYALAPIFRLLKASIRMCIYLFSCCFPSMETVNPMSCNLN